MPRYGWDEFLKAYPSVHLVAGVVPRTANAARLGRPGRVNQTWFGLMETVVATLKPAHGWSIGHVPDATGSVVLCAFERLEDADRLAALTRATEETRITGTWADRPWASRRTFLYDRHARRELVDFTRSPHGDPNGEH